MHSLSANPKPWQTICEVGKGQIDILSILDELFETQTIVTHPVCVKRKEKVLIRRRVGVAVWVMWGDAVGLGVPLCVLLALSAKYLAPKYWAEFVMRKRTKMSEMRFLKDSHGAKVGRSRRDSMDCIEEFAKFPARFLEWPHIYARIQ
jgi:hypothetical protein